MTHFTRSGSSPPKPKSRPVLDAPPPAPLELDTASERATRDLEDFAQQMGARLKGRNSLTFTSRGKSYTFYRHWRASILQVKISTRYPKVSPTVEALAARLRQRRVCPTCSRIFPENGRQRFCKPACSTNRRAKRYRRAQGWKRDVAEMKAIIGRVDARALPPDADTRRAARRAARARARKQQRAKLKHWAEMNEPLRGQAMAPSVIAGTRGRVQWATPMTEPWVGDTLPKLKRQKRTVTVAHETGSSVTLAPVPAPRKYRRRLTRQTKAG